MFCSRSVTVHLSRGVSAIALIGIALYLGVYQSGYGLFAPLLLIGAFVLLRGCPMCWLAGLFETIAKRKPAGPDR
jgi:hypothetical protein